MKVSSRLVFPVMALAVAASASLAGAETYLTTNKAANPTGGTLGTVGITNQGLVGAGRFSGANVDIFGESFGAASGLAITNWSYNAGTGKFSGTFNVLPDRGAGDGAYNYAARMHQLTFDFTPYYGAGPVGQTQISNITYTNTSTKFTYNDNGTVKFASGLIPTGTGTILGQTVGTVNAANGQGGNITSLLSFDAEAVHLFNDGSGFVSDEYGTYIARINSSKVITNITQLPAAAQPRVNGNLDFGSNQLSSDSGRRNNQGLEGMSVSPDGTRLFALMQSALVQDTNGGAQQTRTNTRLFVYDIEGGKVEAPVLVGEYAVQLPNLDRDGTGPSADRTAAQSEILALSNSHFLVLTRDGNGLGNGDTRPAVYKSIKLVDIAGASNILGQYDGATDQISPLGVLRNTITAATSLEVVNLINENELTKFGLNLNNGAKDSNTLAEKWEAMSLVPNLATAETNDYFLFVANDNDFQSANTWMVNTAGELVNIGDTRDSGITNDGLYLVYAVTIVPEPASLGVLGLGAAALFFRRRSRA